MEGQQLRARQAQRRAEEHAGDRQSLAMAAVHLSRCSMAWASANRIDSASRANRWRPCGAASSGCARARWPDARAAPGIRRPRGDAGDLVVGALNAGEDQHGMRRVRCSRLIWRQKSRPPISGNIKSRMIRSTCSRPSRSKASEAPPPPGCGSPRIAGGPQQAEVDILSFQNQNGGGLYGFLERPLDEELPRPRRAGSRSFSSRVSSA